MKHPAYIAALSILLFAACKNDSQPNYEYFPNMYEAVSYDTYQESRLFPNGSEAQSPVEMTIARGHSLYPYPNTNEGYEKAKAELVNPLEVTEANLSRGGALYNVYCSLCHGQKGDGQGILVKREKFLGVPNYKDRDITPGSIYHVIYYGRNAMGSHAAQLSEQERWLVAMYVESLKNKLLN